MINFCEILNAKHLDKLVSTVYNEFSWGLQNVFKKNQTAIVISSIVYEPWHYAGKYHIIF